MANLIDLALRDALRAPQGEVDHTTAVMPPSTNNTWPLT
jgi:hypothetical protein